MTAEPFYAFIATAGFAVLFRVPGRLLIPVGMGGGLGWWVYLGAFDFASSAIFATFTAAIWIGGYGEVLARVTRSPASIFSTCAIIPLVPGKGIFETMMAAVQAAPIDAVTHGLKTIAIAGAIASGLSFVTALMPRNRPNAG